MGWNDSNKSNFGHIYFKNRSFENPNIIGYMESHDEERLMYKNLNFGNGNASYSTQNFDTGLERNAMTAAFFFSIPGPKMIWQFGEIGYEFSINRCVDGSINENCRLARKPIQWEFATESNRLQLYDLYSQMFQLKMEYPAIERDAEVQLNLGGLTKSIISSKGEDHLVVIGNFEVIEQEITVDMPVSGDWFDYLNGGSIFTGSTYSATLAPGEYYVYVNNPDYGFNIIEEEKTEEINFVFGPNPTSDNILHFNASFSGLYDLEIYSFDGRKQMDLKDIPSSHVIDLSNLDHGVFFIRVICDNEMIGLEKIIVLDNQ